MVISALKQVANAATNAVHSATSTVHGHVTSGMFCTVLARSPFIIQSTTVKSTQATMNIERKKIIWKKLVDCASIIVTGFFFKF